MVKIYLASPYSHVSGDIRQERYEAVCMAASKILKQGHIVFSPIAHSHNIHVVGGLPGGWDFWEKIDTAFIEWCDEFWVLMLPGWQDSRGIQAELSIAGRLGKAIRYLEP